MVSKLVHVGIATRSIAVSAEFYRALGLTIDRVEVREADQIRVAVLRLEGCSIELMEPISERSPVHRFLENRGEGIHHIALQSEDLESELRTLAARGTRLIDREPRPGAEGREIAFVHPHSTSGVLIELCQCEEEEEGS